MWSFVWDHFCAQNLVAWASPRMGSTSHPFQKGLGQHLMLVHYAVWWQSVGRGCACHGGPIQRQFLGEGWDAVKVRVKMVDCVCWQLNCSAHVGRKG